MDINIENIKNKQTIADKILVYLEEKLKEKKSDRAAGF